LRCLLRTHPVRFVSQFWFIRGIYVIHGFNFGSRYQSISSIKPVQIDEKANKTSGRRRV
jgi:hypothetical protein